MKQRLLTILLTLLPLMVSAEAIEVNGIYYNLDTNENIASVTSHPKRYSGDIVIPESIEYENTVFAVTSIGNSAFQNCSSLIAVTLPNSITTIGSNAFENCDGLSSIVIPENVISIGASAFNDCDGLVSITIPNNVTSIGSKSYYNCDKLATIAMGDGVKTIGSYAFYNCNSLTSVTIPSSVTSINSYAFGYCYGLTSITILCSPTSIGSSPFIGCSSLKEVKFDCDKVTSLFRDYSYIEKIILTENVKEIGSGAFYGFSGLTAITIPNSVTSIGNEAFFGCSGLTSISIPNGVTSIGNDAFARCSGMRSLEIGSGVTSIGNNAFSGCNKLETVILGSNVTSIGSSAFWNCAGLTSLTIPSCVTSIGSYAFQDCYGLTSVMVLCSPTSIGKTPFLNCTKIKEVTFDCKRVPSLFYGFSNIDKITLTENVTEIGNNAFSGFSGMTNISIPSSVTSIGNEAFYNCSSLTFMSIPDNVTSIGNYAFNGCKGLTSLLIPSNMISIGNFAFYDCDGLTSMTIPNNVTTIGVYAFGDCDQLTSIIIGSGVTSIGSDAFRGSNLTKTIWLTNTPPSGYLNASGKINYVANEQYSSIGNKVVYPFLSSYFEADGIIYVPVSPSERTCDAIDCIYDESAENVTIASTVVYRGITMNVINVLPYVAYSNKFIKNATIDYDGIIPNYAFYGCSNLENAIITEKVTDIDSYAFQGCSSLQSIAISQNELESGTLNIANSINSVGNYAFDGCSSLAEAIISKSITSIGNYAFNGCTGLKTIIIADREDELTLGSNGSSPLFASCPLDSVYIGGNISYNINKNYGYSPFYRNTTLRTVVITDKETEISPNEFYGCTNLQTFSVGDGVTSFGDWAFSGCSSLKTLAFGSQLSSIGKEAFSDCAVVTEIRSKATTPPTCGSQALDDINKWNCKLIVPAGCMTAYQNADQWKEFFFVEEDGVAPKKEYTLTYIVDGETYKTVTVKEDETITPEDDPTKEGYTFSGWSDIPETMPDHDVTVTGTFTINKYKLTYIVDGEEYKSYEIEYNSGIDAEEAPTKEGYTFSGWSEIPETMPAKDVTVKGTFTINKYKLIYKVDDEEYKSYDVEYNSAITAETVPTKEGYTFSGWSEIPETMPAHDVTVTGTFTINKYKLTYIVDGEEYKSIEVEYNSTITPEADPTKDGYNFSGWSDIPETMPAHDVTVTGSFERRYDVGNVTSLISFILRGNGGSDDLAIYDMNGDGVLNIGDLILIVRKVLNSTKRSAITRADMNYLAPDLTQYSAAQFVLNVPENVREQDISLVEGIKQTHQMMCQQIEPGAYAVVVYSLTNSLFMPENGNIVEVSTEKAHSDELSIQDVMLAKPTGETKIYDNMPVRTSISDVEIENDHRHVYDLKGQKQSRVNGMQKGVYIENGKKIVVR